MESSNKTSKENNKENERAKQNQIIENINCNYISKKISKYIVLSETK